MRHRSLNLTVSLRLRQKSRFLAEQVYAKDPQGPLSEICAVTCKVVNIKSSVNILTLWPFGSLLTLYVRALLFRAFVFSVTMGIATALRWKRHFRWVSHGGSLVASSVACARRTAIAWWITRAFVVLLTCTSMHSVHLLGPFAGLVRALLTVAMLSGYFRMVYRLIMCIMLVRLPMILR